MTAVHGHSFECHFGEPDTMSSRELSHPLQTAWKLKPGKKYFLTRNQSTVVGHVLQKQQKQ